jgi:hypothetical protein
MSEGLNAANSIAVNITNAQNDLTEARNSIATASQNFNCDLITTSTYVISMTPSSVLSPCWHWCY